MVWVLPVFDVWIGWNVGAPVYSSWRAGVAELLVGVFYVCGCVCGLVGWRDC